MTAVVAIVVVGVATYLTRALLLLWLAGRRLPEVAMVMLQFVAPAVLSALIVALQIDDEGRVALGPAELAAFAAAGLVVVVTRNHIYTLMAGMAVYWLARALV